VSAFALEDGMFITLTRLIRAEWMDSGECINGSIARPKVATRMAVCGGKGVTSMGKLIVEG